MINYGILNESVKYYTENGFSRIETPWAVSEYIDSLTRPDDMIAFRVNQSDDYLVGSGEQSFLSLYCKEYLPKR